MPATLLPLAKSQHQLSAVDARVLEHLVKTAKSRVTWLGGDNVAGGSKEDFPFVPSWTPTRMTDTFGGLGTLKSFVALAPLVELT